MKSTTNSRKTTYNGYGLPQGFAQVDFQHSISSKIPSMATLLKTHKNGTRMVDLLLSNLSFLVVKEMKSEEMGLIEETKCNGSFSLTLMVEFKQREMKGEKEMRETMGKENGEERRSFYDKSSGDNSPKHSAINMTITNSCPLFFLCFIMPLLVFCDVGIHSGTITKPLAFLSNPSSETEAYIILAGHEDTNGSITVSLKAEHAHPTSRKFLLHNGSCTNKDISISQSKGSTSGIPQYIVQIVNTCVSGCAPHDIHLHCGWFASARIINPKLFKRLSYDDCLVNGGKPLASSEIIRFTYSNSFMYPLTFKSAKFC
ncbi:uncharacterized protein LOC133291684 [Gastrolobium bilobum]|uniref:uncharacterized protein LOC133291684 n=1 Tax=Gastrolobium bilobum TaxID=150636 RepID=UPI002AB2E17B|nr:uncharacterized protein LOC133291684 [Gastrolobium bilobum]